MNEVIKTKIKHGLINNSFTKTLISNFKTKIADAIVQHVVDKTINFISQQTTVTMTIPKYGHNIDDNPTYKSFIVWLNKNTGPSSNKSVSTDRNSEGLCDLGEKSVYFTYKRHHFFVYKKSNNNITNIVITMIGRNTQIMKDLYEEFKPVYDETQVHIYTSHMGGGWQYLSQVAKRKLNSVVIKKETKDAILNRIKDWQKSEEWYKDRGISYKLSMILYGPPGSGKTSLIKAIASELNYNVYLLDLKHFTDSSLINAISNTDPNSIIVLEDFDSHDIVKARSENLKTTGFEGEEEENAPEINRFEVYSEKLTLKGILNALDGIVPIDNKIIIMTTNTLSNIDAALTRKGRVDAKFFIDKMGDKEVKEYIGVMFPKDEIPEGIEFSKIVGCDLQDLYFENKFSFEEFIEAIPKENTMELEAGYAYK